MKRASTKARLVNSPSEIDRGLPGKHPRPMARRSGQLGPDIGKRLRRAMRLRGFSNRSLAAAIPVATATVQAIKDGRGHTSAVGLLVDIAKALKIEPGWLCFGLGDGPEAEEEEEEEEAAATD